MKPSHFLKWDPWNVDVHFISFNLIYIYIAYVSWSFENTHYKTKFGILTVVLIWRQGQPELEIENWDLQRTHFDATNLMMALEF